MVTTGRGQGLKFFDVRTSILLIILMIVLAACPEIDLTLRASLIICMLSVSAWVEEGGTSWGNNGVDIADPFAEEG